MGDEANEDRYDAETLRGDLARIRAKLRRLDGERQTTVEKLEAAMAEAERLLAERWDHSPPPSGP
jgi:hypothetical protein